jgi:hypothetical protein
VTDVNAGTVAVKFTGDSAELKTATRDAAGAFAAMQKDMATLISSMTGLAGAAQQDATALNAAKAAAAALRTETIAGAAAEKTAMDAILARGRAGLQAAERAKQWSAANASGFHESAAAADKAGAAFGRAGGLAAKMAGGAMALSGTFGAVGGSIGKVGALASSVLGQFAMLGGVNPLSLAAAGGTALAGVLGIVIGKMGETDEAAKTAGENGKKALEGMRTEAERLKGALQDVAIAAKAAKLALPQNIVAAAERATTNKAALETAVGTSGLRSQDITAIANAMKGGIRNDAGGVDVPGFGTFDAAKIEAVSVALQNFRDSLTETKSIILTTSDAKTESRIDEEAAENAAQFMRELEASKEKTKEWNAAAEKAPAIAAEALGAINNMVNGMGEDFVPATKLGAEGMREWRDASEGVRMSAVLQKSSMENVAFAAQVAADDLAYMASQSAIAAEKSQKFNEFVSNNIEGVVGVGASFMTGDVSGAASGALAGVGAVAAGAAGLPPGVGEQLGSMVGTLIGPAIDALTAQFDVFGPYFQTITDVVMQAAPLFKVMAMAFGQAAEQLKHFAPVVAVLSEIFAAFWLVFIEFAKILEPVWAYLAVALTATLAMFLLIVPVLRAVAYGLEWVAYWVRPVTSFMEMLADALGVLVDNVLGFSNDMGGNTASATGLWSPTTEEGAAAKANMEAALADKETAKLIAAAMAAHPYNSQAGARDANKIAEDFVNQQNRELAKEGLKAAIAAAKLAEATDEAAASMNGLSDSANLPSWYKGEANMFNAVDAYSGATAGGGEDNKYLGDSVYITIENFVSSKPDQDLKYLENLTRGGTISKVRGSRRAMSPNKN